MLLTLKLRSFALQEADNISVFQTPRKCDTLLSYLCATSWASRCLVPPGQESKNQLKCLQQLLILMPPPWRTWAAADSCTLYFATLPSLNHLANPNGGHNHNWAKIIRTHMSSGYFEVLFWNLLVCRDMNENACIFSVLKSTGCIPTCIFCMCKYMCASIQTCGCMGILNLQHPVHTTGSLNFKKQSEVIKMLLRRVFAGQYALPSVQNGCLLPPSDQVSHDFFLAKSWKSQGMEISRSSEQPCSSAALPFLQRSFS